MGRVIDKRLFGLINDYITLYLPNYKSASEHTLRSYRKAVEELLEFIKEKDRITLFEVSFDRYNGPPKSLHPFTIHRERGIIKPKEQKNHDTKDVHSGIQD